MSRQYRQKGYMDSDSDRGRPQKRNENAPVKGRVETRFRRTIRCSECSAMIQFIDDVKASDICKNCGADVHTCRNCKFFDPGAPNQCMKPVTQRIEGKNVRNLCPSFAPKILVEKAVEEDRKKEASTSDGARKAFDDLFKT